MRIVLSKDRPAQLDLLLTSLERYASPEPTSIIWRASSQDFGVGYYMIWDGLRERRADYWPLHEAGNFEPLVRGLLTDAGEYVTFICDDDVLFGDVGEFAKPTDERVLCFSLRLGANTTHCYPLDAEQRPPTGPWHWQDADGDFGYPGSLDGHVFRTADVQRLLAGVPFANPTHLEDALQRGCFELAEERPLMTCYARSVLVSVPANRVSDQSQVRHGQRAEETAEALNARFLAGGRLSLDAMDFSAVDAAHCELPLVWA